MKTLGLVVWLAALALPAIVDAAPAPPPAPAPPTAAYQFTTVPGSVAFSAVVLRVAVATGQTALDGTGATLINVVDSTPPGPGDYRVSSWAAYDATGARTAWNANRVDLQSGRIWALTYDGKSAASWTLVTGP